MPSFQYLGQFAVLFSYAIKEALNAFCELNERVPSFVYFSDVLEIFFRVADPDGVHMDK